MPVHIDTHVHVVSPDEESFPLDPSGLTGEWYRDDPCSVERLVDLMDEAGVDAAVLVQAVSAYGYDNRYCADAARRFPDRCTSVACVRTSAVDAADVARGLIEDEGMRGVRWMALHGESLGEPEALWGTIARLHAPALVTILGDRLEELAETIPSLPAVPVALDHCGFADFSRGVPPALTALAELPTLHLKISTNVLDLMARHGDPPEMVAELAARFGAERLMWGSDYSQTHDRPYRELVEQGRAASARLSEDQRAAFLGGTALSVWPELGRGRARR